jgi:hypothetical protein
MEKHLFRRVEILGMSRLLLTSCFLLCFAAAVAGDTSGDPLKFRECSASDPRESAVLLLDLTQDFSKGNVPARLLLASKPADVAILERLNTLLKSCPSIELGAGRGFLKEAELTKVPRSRLPAGAGTKIAVLAFHVGGLAEVLANEVHRDTQLVTDLGDLLTLILEMRKKSGGGTAAATLTVARADYVLKESRSTLTFSVIPYSKPAAEDSEEAETSQAVPKDPIKVAEIITGVPEHFSISANIPVNSVNQVDYDQDKKQLVTSETPREFLAGLDWYWGDIKTKDFPWYDRRRLGVKALLRFSDKPLETVGVVAAYRWESFSILAGPIWTRVTRKAGTNPDGGDVLDREYDHEWRVGLGFDLTTARSWLSKGSDSKESKE